MSSTDPRGLPREPAQQKTDLEVFLRVRAPELLRKHAANLILGVMIVAAAVVFFYSRSQTKATNAAVLAQRTANAYDRATQARTAILDVPSRSPAENRERQSRVQMALDEADVVLAAAESTNSQKAVALLAKAEVYWALANADPEQLATSQPAAGFDTSKKPEAYLADAEAAYTEILGKYTDLKSAVGNAMLGLAAIAENRHDWETARKWYTTASNDQTIAGEFRDAAKARLTMLANVQRPFDLAPPASQPSTPAAQTPSFGAPSMLLPSTPAAGSSGFGSIGNSAPTATDSGSSSGLLTAPSLAPATTQPMPLP